MHDGFLLGSGRADRTAGRRSGQDQEGEERAGDADDHDPDHRDGGGRAAGAGERGGHGHRHGLGDAEDGGGGAGDVAGLLGGQCAGVAEDERLDRHQHQESGTGQQQRRAEREDAHRQGGDRESGEDQSEPDQSVVGRKRPTILALTIDSRTWDSAVAAKNSANGIGCRPFCSCSTYEEFAM